MAKAQNIKEHMEVISGGALAAGAAAFRRWHSTSPGSLLRARSSSSTDAW